MKRILFVAAVGTLLCGNLYSQPLIMEDERYVTIFDTTSFLGDLNFNLIRLYKVDVKPRFRKEVPSYVIYTPKLREDLQELRVTEEMACLALDYKKVVTDQKNKAYFYKTFSPEVDKYLGERLAIASTERGESPLETRVWSIPGEIIYFDDVTKKPCEAEVGAFQYTVNGDWRCSLRCFVRYGRCRVVEDHHGVIHHFWSSYQHLDHTPVGDLISSFLGQQTSMGYDFFSKLWYKDIQYLVQRYNSLVGVDFV